MEEDEGDVVDYEENIYEGGEHREERREED